MALEIGGGEPTPVRAKRTKKKEAASKPRSTTSSSRSKKSGKKAIRRSAPARVSSTTTRSLETEPSRVSSDPQASRELTSEQASVSARLTGESAADSNRASFLDRLGGPPNRSEEEATQVEESETPSLWSTLRERGEEIVEDVVDGVREARQRREEEEAQLVADAQQALAEFSADPEVLNEQLNADGLSPFTDAERLAIAQLAGDDEAVGRATEAAVRSDIESLESFEDIPQDRASQILLHTYAGEEQTERLGDLLQEHLETGLDTHIDRLHEDGLRGDEQADGAIEELLSEAEDLVTTHPALAAQLEDRFNQVMGSSAGQISDVRRNDDRWYQQVGHAVSGGVRFLGGSLGDGLRVAVRGAGDLLALPQELASDLASVAIEGGGELLGTGLEAVGQDGAADFVRDTSDTVSGGIQTVSDLSSNLTDDVFIGLSEGAGATVEGLGEALANPVGTVQGLATIANSVNILTLPADIIRNGGSVSEALEQRGEVLGGVWNGLTEGYRETNDEHGAVAAGSQVLFDVLTTVGTGGVVAGGRTAASVGSRIANLGRATPFIDDVARFGDEGARIANLGSDTAGLADNLAGLSDDVGGLADEVAALSDEAASLVDDLPSEWVADADRAAVDPYDPLVRSQVRSPGFPQNREFLEAINSSVDELSQSFLDTPPGSVREALDQLQDSDIADWRRGGVDASDSFFELRQPGDGGTLFTGVNGRYADATSPFGNFGERVSDLISDGPNTATVAGSEATTLTNLFGRGSILHAPASSVDNILGAADDALARALDPATSLDDTVRAVAEVNWHIAQASPFTRGSASAAEVVVRSILDARGIRSSAYRPGISPDLESFVTSLDDFTNRYGDFFEVPPAFG